MSGEWGVSQGTRINLNTRFDLAGAPLLCTAASRTPSLNYLHCHQILSFIRVFWLSFLEFTGKPSFL